MRSCPLVFTFLFSIVSTQLQGQETSLVSDTTLARGYYQRGQNLEQKALYDSAMLFFGQAAQMYKNHRLWSLYLHCRHKVARGLVETGKTSEALEILKKTRQESLIRLGPDHLQEAEACHILGLIADNQADYDQALAYYRKALEIRFKRQGPNHAQVAALYHNIGGVYHYKDQNKLALEYLERGLKLRLQLLGTSHPVLATSYNNIGNVYSYTGEHHRALEYYHKCLQVALAALGEMHPSVALYYNNLGAEYKRIGDEVQALFYTQKALHINRKTLGEGHPRVAFSYNNMGNLYRDQGDLEQAQTYYQKSLEINLQALGEHHTRVAINYKNLAGIYFAQGLFKQALDHQMKALHIRRQVLGPRHPELADSYNALASYFLATHQYLKALQQVQKALLVNMPAFRDTLVARNPSLHPKDGYYQIGRILFASLVLKAQTWQQLFLQSRDMGDLQRALDTYSTADTLAQQLQQAFMEESDKVAFSTSAQEKYQQALSVCLRLYGLTQDRKYLDKAFYFAERGKASVLSASLAESRAKTFAGIPDTLLEQDQQLRSQVARLGRQVAGELSQGKQQDSAGLQAAQSLLFEARRQQEQLLTRLEQSYPQYHQLKHQTQSIRPEQLQAALDDKTAVLSYAIQDSLLNCFVITRQHFEVTSAPLDKNFARQVAAFREAILQHDQGLYRQLAYRLYRLLLPAALPPAIRQIIVIPEGELTTLPFEALISRDTRFGRPPYLLGQYAVSYAYSARLLYQRLTQTPESGDRQLLAFAPVFADQPAHTLAAANRSVLARHQPAPGPIPANPAAIEIRLRGFLLNGQYVLPLPASRGEVEAIARSFRNKGAGAEVYLQNQAREEKLKNTDLSTFNYLHLATHGFVNESYPELSGLLLAQDSTSGEDGILYTGEIYNLSLAADLVTLSACETGLGKLVKGEGLIGLSRALLYAGARNVAVSLWKVSDASTAVLMARFYDRLLAGRGKAPALQAAKLKMAHRGRYADPYYWAPFILIGK